jgi:hypothetical protein
LERQLNGNKNLGGKTRLEETWSLSVGPPRQATHSLLTRGPTFEFFQAYFQAVFHQSSELVGVVWRWMDVLALGELLLLVKPPTTATGMDE